MGHHLPLRSRSLHHQKESTQYGLEDLSWPLFQPSNKCGSQNKNTTNLALELYTENASKLIFSFRIHAYEGNQNYIFELIFFIILSKQRRLFSIKEILMFLTLLANNYRLKLH